MSPPIRVRKQTSPGSKSKEAGRNEDCTAIQLKQWREVQLAVEPDMLLWLIKQEKGHDVRS